MGVSVYPNGEATLRVWAPHATSLEVELEDGSKYALQRVADTW